MFKKRNKLFVILLTASLVFSLSACGGNTAEASDEPAAAPATSEAPPSAGAPADMPESSAETAESTGGVLKFGVRGSINTIGYPGTINTQQEQQVSVPAIETLGRFDETGKVVPFLAEDIIEDADAKTITIKLRDGVKFHDGTPLDAEAVKWNLETTTREKGTVLSTTVEYVIEDPLTLILQLGEWDNTMAMTMTVQSQGYMASPTYIQEVGIDAAVASPVGTGPYKFVSWQKDVSIVYEKNPDYWGPEPQLDGIEIYTFADATSVISAMRTGEIDGVMNSDPEVTEAMLLDGMTFANRSLATGVNVSGLIFTSNDESVPTYDVRVRKAISHAIDSKAIQQAYAKGGSYVYTNQLAAPTSWSFNPDVVGYEYDIEKAKMLLTEAGYPDGFAITAYCVSSNAANRRTLEMVQAYLQQVNITVNIELVEQSLNDEMSAKTGWNGGMMIFGHGANSDIAGQIDRLCGTTGGGRFSVGCILLPEVSEAAEKAITAKTHEEKMQYTQALQKIVYDDYCIELPFYSKSPDFFLKDYVHEANMGVFHGTIWTPELIYSSK
jgi:ABC-type transport system substrate-binding protein